MRLNRPTLTTVLCALATLILISSVLAGSAEPVIKQWMVKEKNDKGELVDVPYMSIDGVLVHEEDPAKQPQPPIVTPGIESTQSKPGTAPSDAIVLFDGKNLNEWTSMVDGEATKWILHDHTLSPTKDSGWIRSKRHFGSCQVHVEWAAPANVKGDGQGRGNSGVFLMGIYEVQILDSYNNKTYPDGQAGALYGRKPPLVNACRRPGQWQAYDIIFHRPIFKDGQVVRRATVTVFQNGVLVQDHTELTGGTLWLSPHAVVPYAPHADKGPLVLQDHGNPVCFRNVWVRELQD